MKTIPVLKFTPPHGQRDWISCEVEDDEAAKFTEAQSLGVRLTVERLSSGHISQCLEHPEFGDFDQVLTTNGPEVVEKRREMLLRFEKSAFEQFKEAMA